MVSSVKHKSISFSHIFSLSLSFHPLSHSLSFVTFLSLCQRSLAFAGWWSAIRETETERKREGENVWTIERPTEQMSKRASPIIKHVLDLRFYNTNWMTQPPYSVQFIHRLVYPEHGIFFCSFFMLSIVTLDNMSEKMCVYRVEQQQQQHTVPNANVMWNMNLWIVNRTWLFDWYTTYNRANDPFN